MELTTALSSTDINGFHQILDKADVRLAEYMVRVVTADGYDGAVTVNKVASCYLKLVDSLDIPQMTLDQRISAYDLWGKVRKLYLTAEQEAAKEPIWIRLLDRIWRWEPECGRCWQRPEDVIRESGCGIHEGDGPERFLLFAQQEFRRIWPQAKPQREVYSRAYRTKCWEATPSMLRSKL